VPRNETNTNGEAKLQYGWTQEGLARRKFRRVGQRGSSVSEKKGCVGITSLGITPPNVRSQIAGSSSCSSYLKKKRSKGVYGESR